MTKQPINGMAKWIALGISVAAILAGAGQLKERMSATCKAVERMDATKVDKAVYETDIAYIKEALRRIESQLNK